MRQTAAHFSSFTSRESREQNHSETLLADSQEELKAVGRRVATNGKEKEESGTFLDAFPTKATSKNVKEPPVRATYLYSMLIKLSVVSAVLLLIMIVGTARSDNILVEEQIIIEMNRKDTVKISASRDPMGTKALSKDMDQISLEPGILSSYSEALVQRIANNLSPIWGEEGNTTSATHHLRGSLRSEAQDDYNDSNSQFSLSSFWPKFRSYDNVDQQAQGSSIDVDGEMTIEDSGEVGGSRSNAIT